MVSIPACHAGDPGSIPGNGDFFFFFYTIILQAKSLGHLAQFTAHTDPFSFDKSGKLLLSTN